MFATVTDASGRLVPDLARDPRDFTSSHDELREILQHELQPEGPTPLWNAVNVGITDLLHQEGRRVVLVFTDGMDAPGNNTSANNSLKDVMKRAEEENVMVYRLVSPATAATPGPAAAAAGRRPITRTMGCRKSPTPPAAAISS